MIPGLHYPLLPLTSSMPPAPRRIQLPEVKEPLSPAEAFVSRVRTSLTTVYEKNPQADEFRLSRKQLFDIIKALGGAADFKPVQPVVVPGWDPVTRS